MLLHVIRHVPFEGPAGIAEWATERGHVITESPAITEQFPAADDFDFLVLMGGPMSAADHEANPWLAEEKRFVATSIAAGKAVLGICLGAQIIAAAAGGTVRRNEYPEIGWFNVRKTDEAARDVLFERFPDDLVVGHWHGDTFTLPEGVPPVLSSAACANQAFTLDGGRVVGLQFHLEWTPDALAQLIGACADELNGEGPYTSSAEEMLAGVEEHGLANRTVLWALLDAMTLVTRGDE